MSAPLDVTPSWKLPYVSILPASISGAVHIIPLLRLTDCRESTVLADRNRDAFVIN